MTPRLSVVIPAYNESDNLKDGVLDAVDGYLGAQKYQWEAIVVDDGSTDNTVAKLTGWIKTKSHWHLVKNPHRGKAQTVKAGVMAAGGSLILFTDFDQATPISEIEKLLPFINKGYSLVIGSREVKGSERKGEPWHRHIMGKMFNIIVQLFTVRGIHDTQCGFKLFTKECAKDLFNNLVVYGDRAEENAFTGAFDVELLYLAQKRNYKIAEVPVLWTHVKTTRVNPVRDSLRMFLDVLRIRLADISGKYSSV